MASSPPDFPDLAYQPPGLPGSAASADDRELVLPAFPVARRAERKWKYALLFLATFVTTTVVGGFHYAGYLLDFTNRPLTLSSSELYVHGLWYSVSILSILGAHELGHY